MNFKTILGNFLCNENIHVSKRWPVKSQDLELLDTIAKQSIKLRYQIKYFPKYEVFTDNIPKNKISRQ